MKYLNKSAIKTLAKENNRRVGQEFLKLLDTFIEQKIIKACQVHNGGKKTLDAEVAGFVGIK